MKLELSVEEEALLAAAAAFADERVATSIRDLEVTRHVPSAMLAAAAARGLTAAGPSSGAGAALTDAVGTAIVVERLARASAPVALAVGLSNLTASLLGRFDASERPRAWVPKLISGEVGSAVALADYATVRITRQAAGAVTLSGRLQRVPNAQTAAVLLLALAPTSSEAADGLATLLVFPVDASGVRRVSTSNGTKPAGAGWADIDLEEAGADALAGHAEAAASTDAWVRVLAAAMAVGVGRAALGRAIDALKAQPAHATQGVTFGLADSATDLDAAWLVVLKAASRASRGDRIEAAMARLLAAEAAERAVDRAMQVVQAADPEQTMSMMRWWHEARMGDVWLGPPSVERRAIGQHLQQPS